MVVWELRTDCCSDLTLQGRLTGAGVCIETAQQGAAARASMEKVIKPGWLIDHLFILVRVELLQVEDSSFLYLIFSLIRT